MRSKRWLHTAEVLVLILGFWGAAPQLAHAAGFDFSEDFSKFGRQPNNLACLPMAACAAVQSIDSFIYLEEMFPRIYDNKLTPNRQPNMTDPIDATNFGVTGWQVGTNPPRKGYYDPTRPNPDGVGAQMFLDTKKDWINDYAPGTTRFNSWFGGSADNNRKPTINDLAEEIRKGEDVELFVLGANNYYHVIGLTAFKCTDDAMTMCSIRYQDSDGDVNKEVPADIMQAGGMITFTGLLSGQNRAVTITAAFSESPIPEPSVILLLGTGFLGLVGYGWRRRKQVA